MIQTTEDSQPLIIFSRTFGFHPNWFVENPPLTFFSKQSPSNTNASLGEYSLWLVLCLFLFVFCVVSVLVLFSTSASLGEYSLYGRSTLSKGYKTFMEGIPWSKIDKKNLITFFRERRLLSLTKESHSPLRSDFCPKFAIKLTPNGDFLAKRSVHDNLTRSSEWIPAMREVQQIVKVWL